MAPSVDEMIERVIRAAEKFKQRKMSEASKRYIRRAIRALLGVQSTMDL